jgi:energy-coupling factor transporter ATP-binding protein EcfA2
MLVELRIEQLGVIDEVTVVFGDGLTVLTGETGAGKTMIVEAINLLVGQRADASMVRAGADELRVEGRFVLAMNVDEFCPMAPIESCVEWCRATAVHAPMSMGGLPPSPHWPSSGQNSSTFMASTNIRACSVPPPNALRSTPMPKSTSNRCAPLERC